MAVRTTSGTGAALEWSTNRASTAATLGGLMGRRDRTGPPSLWAAGIGAFTTLFAAGQIVGPALVGFVADRAGGLRAGLACSAAVLGLGAIAAWRQKPLAAQGDPR